MAPMKYLPRAWCAKCNREASIIRRWDSKTNERLVYALCHGDTADLEFADEAGKMFRVFEEAPPEIKEEPVSVRPT
jgi:hypothetical protein